MRLRCAVPDRLSPMQYRMAADVPLPFFQPVQALASQDVQVIRTLEWLVHDEATYPDAISAANLMLRYYLGGCDGLADKDLDLTP